jgi:hypothetical protein|tara:strand:+ start:814 stop:1143 length:330 start_codon:yes stop_codon:yes gene_type:complete
MFIKDRLVTTRALLSSFFNKGGQMATATNKGSTYYRVGSQNQQILANYWGTGKTFTLDGLKEKLDIASPGARISELRDAGFNVKTKPVMEGNVGRPVLEYSISRRRTFA